MISEPSLNRWLDRHHATLDAVLMDIDGVVLNSKRKLPGRAELIERLKRLEIPFLFLTNDGNHSTPEKADRMVRAGLTVTPEQIISCGHAIKPLIMTEKLTGTQFFVMGDSGDPCYAEAAGLEVTRDLEWLGDCSGVIIGEENYDWEPVINAVINFFIDHPNAPLIVPNPDEFYPGAQLKIHIAAGGVGRFIQSVLHAYGVEIDPVYLGKPYPPIYELALNALEGNMKRTIEPSKILMVGDNMAADIAGGRAAGFRTALMLTGVTDRRVLSNHDIPLDMVFESL